MKEEKLDLLLQHAVTLIGEVKDIKTGISRLENRMDSLEARMDSLEARMDSLEARMDRLEADVAVLKVDVEGIKEKLENIELTLENETNPNIQIIAEGHLDLFRKLDESLKISHESEIYQIKVNRLDSEIRRIKEFYKNQSINQSAAAN